MKLRPTALSEIRHSPITCWAYRARMARVRPSTENVRSTGLYLFAQDSWKIKPNLTLNYGLRWELNTPIADISKHVQTFRPGQVSTVYPCENTRFNHGLLFNDPGRLARAGR